MSYIASNWARSPFLIKLNNNFISEMWTIINNKFNNYFIFRNWLFCSNTILLTAKLYLSRNIIRSYSNQIRTFRTQKYNTFCRCDRIDCVADSNAICVCLDVTVDYRICELKSLCTQKEHVSACVTLQGYSCSNSRVNISDRIYQAHAFSF